MKKFCVYANYDSNVWIPLAGEFDSYDAADDYRVYCSGAFFMVATKEAVHQYTQVFKYLNI